MKKKVTILQLCCISSFIVAFYLPKFAGISKEGEFEQGSLVHSCSVDHVICAEFKNTIRGDPPYRSAYLSIKNTKTGEYAQINNLFIDIMYKGEVRPAQFIWKNHNQLHIVIDGSSTHEIYNYFFKNLGNVSITLELT